MKTNSIEKYNPLNKELMEKLYPVQNDGSGEAIPGNPNGASDLDWNIMKNKPFEEETGRVCIATIESCEGDGATDTIYKEQFLDGVMPKVGDVCEIIIDGIVYTHTIENNNGAGRYLEYEGQEQGVLYVYEDRMEFSLYGTNSIGVKLEVYQERTIITPLDEKFIPDTIARKSDIPAGLDIPTYKKDEITQELIVELAKNRAVFIYEENANGNGNSVWAQRAIITSYNLAPGEDDGCGDITPPKLELCSGFAGALSYEYINDDIWNEIKAAWGL